MQRLALEFETATDRVKRWTSAIDTVALLAFAVVWILCFYLGRHRFYQTLLVKLQKTRSMVNFLPFELVLGNEDLYREFSSWRID